MAGETPGAGVQMGAGASLAQLAAEGITPDSTASGKFEFFSWWTAGGEDFPPLALASHGLPDPFHYAYLLTGKSPDQSREHG